MGFYNMKKRILGLLIGMMMLATIPIAAGMTMDLTNDAITPEPEITPLGKKRTLVMGIITRPNIFFFGKFISFRAISVRYRVFGEGRTVQVSGLQRMILRNDFKGIVGNNFVCALFEGIPR